MELSTVFAIQSWSLYAIAISLIFSRIIFRRITLGSLRKLQVDDWLMIIVLLPFTASIVVANQIPSDSATRHRKFRYILEEMQIITIWLVKACLLVLFWRIFSTETKQWRKWTLVGTTVFCCLSFLVVQISLIALCQPSNTSLQSTTHVLSDQCTNYHTYTILALPLVILTTLLIMMLPIPFIPTPRRLLLAILLVLSTLVFISSIMSRRSILLHSSSTHFLYWYTAESSLSIIFANLPFLTSLVVTTAPKRIRGLSSSLRASSSLTLSQWPRSRQCSETYPTQGGRHSWTANFDLKHPFRTERSASAATTMSNSHPVIDLEKSMDWNMTAHLKRKSAESRKQISPRQSSENSIAPPSLRAPPPSPRRASLPKTRFSGGLAEMGEIMRPQEASTQVL